MLLIISGVRNSTNPTPIPLELQNAQIQHQHHLNPVVRMPHGGAPVCGAGFLADADSFFSASWSRVQRAAHLSPDLTRGD